MTPEKLPVSRIMHGREMMKAMGWDPAWSNPLGAKWGDHDFLCGLAGHAFSAYTFAPVALATFASMGTLTCHPAPDEASQDHKDDSSSSRVGLVCRFSSRHALFALLGICQDLDGGHPRTFLTKSHGGMHSHTHMLICVHV